MWASPPTHVVRSVRSFRSDVITLSHHVFPNETLLLSQSAKVKQESFLRGGAKTVYSLEKNEVKENLVFAHSRAGCVCVGLLYIVDCRPVIRSSCRVGHIIIPRTRARATSCEADRPATHDTSDVLLCLVLLYSRTACSLAYRTLPCWLLGLWMLRW